MESSENLVTLIVKDSQFKCDKDKLIQCSDYFRAMFSEHFSEREKSFVEIQEVDPEILKVLLDYAETGKFVINAESLTAILEVSSMLQFTYIQTICANHLRSRLSVNNCLSTHRITSLHGIDHVAKAAWGKALWGFLEVMQTQDFLKYTFSELEVYLKDPSLNTGLAGEFAVWEAIENWIRHDEPERLACLLPLLVTLKYGDLSSDDLTTLMFYSYIDSNAEAKSLIQEIKDAKIVSKANFQMSDSNPTINLDLRQRRQLSQIACAVGYRQEEFFALDSSKKFAGSIPTLYGFDIRGQLLEEIVPLSRMSDPAYCQGYKVCSVGPSIYILGGEYMLGYGNWNKNVWSYDTITERWIIESQLPHVRRHHMCCVLDSTIYLLGGYGKHRIMLSSVDAYDTISSEWKSCPDMPGTVNRGASCVYKRKVFVFTNCEIFVFDPDYEKWNVLKLISSHANGFQAAFPYKESIFLIGNFTQKIFELSIQKDLTVREFGSFQNQVLHTCRINSKIYNFTHSKITHNRMIEALELEDTVKDASDKDYDCQGERISPSVQPSLKKSKIDKEIDVSIRLTSSRPVWEEGKKDYGGRVFATSPNALDSSSFGSFPLFKI